MFAALIASRLFGLEEAVQHSLRAALRERGNYDARRPLQALLAVLVIGVVVLGGGFAALRTGQLLRGQRDRAVAAGLAATGAIVVLIALRIISLHAIDRLLYGPLKLNWLGDVGASVIVLFAALYYWRRAGALAEPGG